jgi:hypothetical protein
MRISDSCEIFHVSHGSLLHPWSPCCFKPIVVDFDVHSRPLDHIISILQLDGRSELVLKEAEASLEQESFSLE